MATIGTLSLNLTANTAQFHQEMGKARDTLEKTGKGFSNSEHAAANFASRGLASVIPAANGAEFAITKMLNAALRGGAALRALGQAGLIIGGTLLVASAVQRLQDEIKNWLKLGETIDQTTERLKKEADEQEKFAQRRKAAVQLLIQLEGQLAVARAAGAAETAKQQGRETELSLSFGMRAELEALKTRQDLQRRNIIETIQDAARRDQALTISAQLAAAEQFRIQQKYFGDLAKLREDNTQKAIQGFAKETDALLDDFKRRLDMRKALEARAEALVAQGQVGDPFSEAKKIRDAATAEAEAFAFLLDAGRPWRDLQEEIFRKDQEFAERGFSGFAAAIENFRGKFREIGIDAASIDASWFQLTKRMGDDMPAAINRADPAIAQLIGRLQTMRIEADATASAVQALANVIAGGTAAPAPIVTAPVDLGF